MRPVEAEGHTMARTDVAVNNSRHVASKLFVVYTLLRLTTVVSTHSRIMSGVFTRFLRKYLQVPNLPLVEISRHVTDEVVASKGQEQMPVCEKASQ